MTKFKDPNLSRHFVFLRSHKINQHSVEQLKPIFLFVIAKLILITCQIAVMHLQSSTFENSWTKQCVYIKNITLIKRFVHTYGSPFLPLKKKKKDP